VTQQESMVLLTFQAVSLLGTFWVVLNGIFFNFEVRRNKHQVVCLLVGGLPLLAIALVTDLAGHTPFLHFVGIVTCVQGFLVSIAVVGSEFEVKTSTKILLMPAGVILGWLGNPVGIALSVVLPILFIENNLATQKRNR